METLLCGGDALSSVKARGAADDHQVHRPVCQKSGEIFKWRSAVVATEPPHFFKIRTVDRGNFDPRDGTRGTRMGVGDVAAANQADVKRHGNEGIKALPIRRDKGFVGRLDAFR